MWRTKVDAVEAYILRNRLESTWRRLIFDAVDRCLTRRTRVDKVVVCSMWWTGVDVMEAYIQCNGPKMTWQIRVDTGEVCSMRWRLIFDATNQSRCSERVVDAT
jgi:hypothetical protein